MVAPQEKEVLWILDLTYIQGQAAMVSRERLMSSLHHDLRVFFQVGGMAMDSALKPFKSTLEKKRYKEHIEQNGLVGKKEANCLQASLPSVNIVPQEQIVFLAAQNM